MPVKAITFDFWDTLVFDGSDEPKRAARGLPPKPAARLALITAEVRRHHPDCPPGRVEAAFDLANDHFRHLWRDEHRTPPVSNRLQQVFDVLGFAPTPGFEAVVHEIENMEVHIPPDFVPGVRRTLARLAGDYKLGIISDTIHTPGKGLRQLLEVENILQFFSHFVFSDEAGKSKPAKQVFVRAAAGLGVGLAEVVHVGDREGKDVAGALAAGMQAILFTGARDRGAEGTRAQAVCRNFRDLPAVIGRLAGVRK